MSTKGNVIGVDIDLTVCPTDEMWFEWLISMTQSPAICEFDEVEYKCLTLPELHSLHTSKGEKVNYNLTKYFPKPINSNVDPFDFFRREGIYDLASPYKGCIKTLKMLEMRGYEIVFISHNKGNHSKSKYNFLERWFGQVGGINFHSITTHSKEKFRANVDYIIEDRLLPLNICHQHGIKGILKESNYTQGEDPLTEYLRFDSWEAFPINSFPLIEEN
tara:strand:- start:46451 stop:47104 length:654 start_codon:yes stop_codon:yes gene_type:complete